MSPVPAEPEPEPDPVLVRRARASRLASQGQRVGYLLMGLALVVFLYGLATDFTAGVARIVVGALVAGSVVLAPAIIGGYAVKAAVRDDLEHGRAVE